ncbi:aminotransferase class IV [Nonomuraea sp. NPDC000554]|uniref:aminotransferase class IV n=1 Tax=Nonomuraea sp. NPDC000554 TaxID=3154259 RepID=UPI00332CC99B
MNTVIDGRPAGAGDVALAVTARYGHFTAMQVRGRRVRGLAFHLDRLDSATRELFGQELDRDLVLDSIRTVLDRDDASVRVYVCEVDRLRVIATAAPPAQVATVPQRLRSVRHQRFLAHVKHTGGFAQGYLGRQVQAEGFDEALFTGDDGVISEGSITNLGCFDGSRIVWPDAPMLRGITMRLLEVSGIPSERRVLRVADLPGFEAVFLSNSHGVVAVGQVDDVTLKVNDEAVATVVGAYEATPWDAL